MGIPGFYGNFLSQNVREAIFNGLPPFVASLSFDLNGVFHDARKTVFGDGDKDPRILQAIANTDPMQLELELYNTIANIIIRMVQAANPRDCLILAVDGIAPGAKMQQQRGRRERAAKEKSPIETFDRNAITPGTEFMMRLDNFIVRFIGTYRQYLPPKVIYSSHLVPGEGEHKIMDYYRRGEASDGPAAQAGGAHILYGLDADLIMLSLLSPLNNIYLSRETEKEVINIDRFKEYILARGNKPDAIDDFVVMMFLIGNDFLPHTVALEQMSESISLLLDIYAEGEFTLTFENDFGTREINWDSMKLFIREVAARENELLAALSVRPVKYPSRFLQAALIEGSFYPENFRSVWYQNALGTKGPKDFTNALLQIIGTYIPSEYDLLVDPIVAQTPLTTISEVTPHRIEKMALDYMRTMAWTYLYYREGTDAINLDWAYLYYHAPMLVDLAAVMQTIGITNTIDRYQSYEGMIPFTALHQLVAVLPMKSKELLPLELQPLYSYNSIIRDLFPDNFIIEMDGKNFDHEGVPIVPLIDRQRIFDAVAQITFTPERVKLWMPAQEQIFIRTEEEAERLARTQFDKQRHEEFLARQTARTERAKTFKARPRGTYRPQPQGRIPRQQAQTVQPIPGRNQPLVPTMTATQIARSPGIRVRDIRGGRGVGRGVGRGGGRGGGRRANVGEIRRPPTIPLPTATATQPVLTQPAQTVQSTLRVTAPPFIPPGTQPTKQVTPTGKQVRKGPALVPVGTMIPEGLPVGIPIGKGGVTPGVQVPVTPLPQQGTQIVPVTQPTKQPARSPAQWQQLTNLM
jgi:5'-3' exoribonuclease 1